MALALAARNLTRHRTRTLLSLAAIAFGVVALMLTAGFIQWMFWAMQEAEIYTGLGHVHVGARGFRDGGAAMPRTSLLPRDGAELRDVRSTPGVVVVDQRIAFGGLASREETTLPFAGLAVDADAERLISRELEVSGERLDASDPGGILLGQGLASALGATRGDKITLLISLPDGGINAVEGVVRGIFATHVKAYDDTGIRMTIALGRKLTRIEGSQTWVLLLDAKDDDTSAALGYLRTKLPPQRFEFVTWLEQADFFRKSVSLLSRQVAFVALLIAFIIVLGISNALTMNVMERTREIGTMMAIGARRREVLFLFLVEGLLLGVVGGAAGLAIGFVLAQLLSAVGIPMPPPPGRDEGFSAGILLTWQHAAWGFSLAIASATLAALYPAWRASRMPVVDALRSET